MEAKQQALHLRIQATIIILFIAIINSTSFSSASTITNTSSTRQEIKLGFTAVHDASYAKFQPLLADPTGVFSLGFLRSDSSQLDVAVIHLPSSFPLWRANQVLSWSTAAFLSFNGSLQLFDNSSAPPQLLWSSANAAAGDRLVLLNSSNLRIQAENGSPVWQSFDSPSDTLVQAQNFTSSAALFTSSRLFSLRVGVNYVALYMADSLGSTRFSPYWRHTVMPIKAQMVEGLELYARVEGGGFLGLYQSSQTTPVDLMAFDTFNRGIAAFRRLTLEPDGNLRAYYWKGSAWELDFTAITEPCGLPTACGPYGICASTAGQLHCSCLLDNNTNGCSSDAIGLDNLCAQGVGVHEVVRRQGVDLAIDKELATYEKVASVGECEAWCDSNCTCWGAIYNNVSGFCYMIDHPVQTLVEADDRKLAYLKFTRASGGGGGEGVRRAKLALLVVGVGGVVVFGAVFVVFRAWQRWKLKRGFEDDEVAALPYKNLSSASFRSIELVNTAGK